MGGARWVWQTISLEVRRMLSYRVDFWIHFIGGAAAQMALAFFLWSAVFEVRGVSALRGYDLKGILLYYLMVPLVDRLVRGSEMSYVSRDIYDGGLTRYLLYPVGFFGYRYAIFAAGILLFSFQAALALPAFVFLAGVPEGVVFSVGGFLAAAVLVLAAGAMHFFLATTIELAAFWADNVWSLLVLLRFGIYLLGGGMIPLEFFPDLLQDALVYSPFPYLFSVPIRLCLGSLPVSGLWPALGIVLGWAALFAALTAMVWRRGLLRYTGVGI